MLQNKPSFKTLLTIKVVYNAVGLMILLGLLNLVTKSTIPTQEKAYYLTFQQKMVLLGLMVLYHLTQLIGGAIFLLD